MKKVLLRILAVILGLFLAGCGASASGANLELVMTDFEFTPAAFTVPAGEEVELHVKHDGTVEHDLIIMKYGTDAGHSFEEEDEGNVYWSRAFQPGASETATLTAPSQPGVYQVICGIRGHLEAGMVGSLTVVGP